MMKREEIDRRFLELVRRICQYGEFASGRDDMCRELDRLAESGNTKTMHRDVPWLTDVFFRGILAGEDVQAAARKQLVDEWQKLTVGSCPTSEDGSEHHEAGSAELKSFELQEIADEDSLQTADKALRQLPQQARDEAARRFKEMLVGVFKRGAGAKRFLDWVRCWLGKHGPLPLADYHEWDDGELQSRAIRRADEERMLKSCENASVEVRQEFIAASVRKKASALLSVRDRMSVSRLSWLPEDGVKRLANELDCLELFHATAVSVAYGMNRYGAGPIPPFALAGRLTKHGEQISVNDDESCNVNMVLDTLAMDAFLKLMDIHEVGDDRVPCFGPMRRYLNGSFSPDYLIGMLQNAVANLRWRVLGGDGPKPIPVPDPTRPDGDGTPGPDPIPVPPSSEHEEMDRANFFQSVAGALAPNLFRYFCLIQNGKSKGEALKAVGAKSTHFVEREAKALIKELAKLKGEDVAELSKMLSDLVEGK